MELAENTQNYLEPSGKKFAERSAVEEGIRALLERSRNSDDGKPLKTQKDIQEALKEQGIETPQSMISRILRSMGAERDARGYWAGAQAAYEKNLKELEELFTFAGGVPHFFSQNIQVAVLWTEPGFNAAVAQKIADTFPLEVLSTMCPNDTDVIIYYRLRKKKREVSENKMGEASAPSFEDAYKKSQMTRALRDICKRIQQGKKK